MKIQKQPSRGVLIKSVPKICNKLTGKRPYQSAISINLQSNFIETALRCGCSPVNLLYFLRTPFSKNNSGRLPLKISLNSKI